MAATDSSAASKYKKLSHREHILQLPDTYIGSIETHDEWRWVYDPASQKMVHKYIKFNPGFYKIFDEIIVNARDARVRSLEKKKGEAAQTPIKKIDICVKEVDDKLQISVENDGDGIPIEEHPEHKIWVPELIFGHLLTSGNYDKGEEKIVGGKNGYGSKVSNVFSSTFTVDVRSPAHEKKYTQVWSENMSKCAKACVRADKAKTGYVKVTYEPDLSRFQGWDESVKEDMIGVLRTRAYELAALCGSQVKVSWNGETIPSNTFEKFVRLFVRDQASVVYEACGSRWEVAAVLSRSLYEEDSRGSDEGAASISFVNGINTRKGGKHVDTVVRHVLTDFCEAATKKKVPVKPAQVRSAVVFFVNATIVNPSFDSQTKETLTTAANKFGSVFKTDGALVTGLMKAGLLEEAQAALDAKAAKEAKKTDGVKKKTLRGLPKLVDALWAGTAKSEECILILTEGDSAATSAMSGLSVVGRERFGIFPLRGKLLNVKDISQEKFNKNEELTAIKAIVGLQQGRKYESKQELRYGRVMVMADQDHDGSHIKGLLMNLFHTEWPELMKLGFICSLATPLLKATKGKQTISFYNMGEFDAWKEANEGGRGWYIKYYKGLGTSTKVEAREWFERLAEIHYEWDDGSDESISLAFHKKRADDRKGWLANYDPKRVLNIGAGGHIPFTRFIHDELIHFSNADNLRSLPQIMDGLKPSQRKILFGCFKRNLRSEVKVAQLAGYVSEHACYHHGETSLCETIVGMAQNFVGANNINLLLPQGQFGSRVMGGKDSASARYIFTCLEGITDKIYRKEDQAILNYLDDDGVKVEPDFYLPTLPMLLVNGSVGIGTGFSTNIPPYNPSDLIRVLRDRLKGNLSSLEMVELKPWWAGFRGEIVSGGDDVWVSKGVYEFDDDKHSITITELPVGVWTMDYKAFLDEMTTSSNTILQSFDDLFTDDVVKFVLHFSRDVFEDMVADPEDFEKKFKLKSVWRTTNMVAFSKNMTITKYGSVGEMLETFYTPRLEAYEKRREKEIARLDAEAIESDAKARFIKAVLEGTLELRRATDEQIMAAMVTHKLPALSGEATSVDGWEYLLRLRMDRVKASAVKDAEEAVARARAALADIQGKTGGELWLKDLEEVEAAWEKMMVARAATVMEAKSGGGGRKKPAASKPRAKKSG
jgi:DNA topoisomerase-2